MIIADGYHTLSAVYDLSEDPEISCNIVQTINQVDNLKSAGVQEIAASAETPALPSNDSDTRAGQVTLCLKIIDVRLAKSTFAVALDD